MSNLYYYPLDEKCKNLVGAVQEDLPLRITVFVEDALSCDLMIRQDDEYGATKLSMTKTDCGFFIDLKKPVGLYWYYFLIDGKKVGRNSYLKAEYQDYPNCYQLSIYKSEYQTPSWFKQGVMYQIFPDRFCRVKDGQNCEGKFVRDDWGGTPIYRANEYGKVLNNDFFGGNFKGIESKLNYLKELGVNTIYLNPIVKAYSNHRYDTSDYMQFDSLLGTDEDFKSLVENAKKLGINFVLDGVFNHTGDDSIYFNKYNNYNQLGAYQSKESKYYNWYCFENYPNKYLSWWGIDTLPTINKNSKDFEDFIVGNNGVLDRWLSFGVKGIRLDVVDELPDSFVERIRDTLKSKDTESLLIGEVWEDATNKIAYSVRRKYFLGKELDSVMNYPLKDAIINFVLNGDLDSLVMLLQEQINNYPLKALNCLMNILDTHDTQRILLILGKGDKIKKYKSEMEHEFLTNEDLEKAIKLLKISTILQYFLYGVPCVYYGDEAGLYGNKDPFNRKCFPWDNVNEEIHGWYVKLGKIRNSLLFLKDAKTKIFYYKDNVLILQRYYNNKKLYIVINNSLFDKVFKISEEVIDLLNNNEKLNTFEVKSGDTGIYLFDR